MAKTKYGEKEGVKNYNLTPGTWDRMGVGMLLTKVEFWSFQYDFSFQFWGPDQNHVYISRSNIEIASFAQFPTVKDMLDKVVEWCEKANPRIKYPEAIIGKPISLPD